MEHILQFGINIDDNEIVNTVKEKAEREIIAQLKIEVARCIFVRDSWNKTGYDDRHLSVFSEKVVTDFMNEHKTEIIDAAARILADRLARSKAGKAIFDNLE